MAVHGLLPRCRHLFCDKVKLRKAELVHTGVHEAMCRSASPLPELTSASGPCARLEPRSPSYSPLSRRKRSSRRCWRSRSSGRRFRRDD